ncbi:hypothetical protein [Paracandidimonas soli]|uniref:Uncharacterized protein n=2 Tax=Paracandidimonas soli TaxID=1917182 RepID=A0A4R3UQE4_9BURK|nr:hypothetical protein [Paracandidimonas soli]TCU92568.1 hypothetical protein EV686_1145 [Paracandidimonas soli]
MQTLKTLPPDERTGGFGWVQRDWLGADSIVPNSDKYVIAEQVRTQMTAVLRGSQSSVRIALRGYVVPVGRSDLADVIHEQMLQQSGVIADMVAALDGCQSAAHRASVAFDAAVVTLAHETARRLRYE